MVIQKVTEGWKVRSRQTGQCFETKVPGTVYGPGWNTGQWRIHTGETVRTMPGHDGGGSMNMRPPCRFARN